MTRASMFDTEPKDRVAVEAKVRKSDAEFWRRLPSIDLEDKTILDFGCGDGTLIEDILARGAKRVVGLDIAPNRIDQCRRRFCQPAAAERTQFICGELDRIDDDLGCFDVIVSKDTFEHVEVPATTLRRLVDLLRPGGCILLGFSPLYYSPFGDHGFITRHRWPWLHLLVGQRGVLRAINRRNGTDFESLPAAGLNGLTPRAYLDAIRGAALAIEFLSLNPGSGLKGALMQAFSLLRQIRPLEPLFTVGFYVVLRREGQ